MQNKMIALSVPYSCANAYPYVLSHQRSHQGCTLLSNYLGVHKAETCKDAFQKFCQIAFKQNEKVMV